MKSLRHVLLIALLFGIIVRPTNGCSPGDPIAIFIQQRGPDAPYKAFAAGRLGVLFPTYRPRHLILAFDYLNGHPLNPQEQAQAVVAEREINWQEWRDSPSKPEDPTPGLKQWIAARTAALASPYTSPATTRKVPGNQYESVESCLDNAFLTAAQTLTARQLAHGKSSPEIANWLAGQDAVFSNCDDGGTLPQPAPANAPLWLQQDRAYQLAAANFYAPNFDTALTGFRTIAADAASPWHILAPYLVARTIIRKASLAPEAPYDKPDQIAAAKQNLQAAYVAALQQLDTILKDPALKTIHPAALDLRDLVAARIQPAAQAQVLAQRLTSSTRTGDLRHNLVDLTYILNNSTDDSGAPLPAATEISTKSQANPNGALAWLQIIRTPIAPASVSTYFEAAEPETSEATLTRIAAQRSASKSAFTRWQSNHQPAWLVAALVLAQPDEASVPTLITAARALPVSSPAYITATYNRLRLEAAAPATRAELLTLLPTVEKSESRSSINSFGSLLSRTAPTLADYLKSVPRIPSGSDFDGTIGSSLEDFPVPQLCGPKLKADQTPLFDQDAATMLNQRLPLRLLREAALTETLPPNLRFQLANATLTRAVLLDDPATAAAITPVLTTCQPRLQAFLATYNAAKTPEERHLQGLLLLMRFPSTEPLVRAGTQRTEGFSSYSYVRDNWWTGNTLYISSPNADSYESGSHTILPGDPKFKPALFSAPILPATLVPSPLFLTPADTTEASKEILALQHIPNAGDYFATQALAWVKAHPTDSNNSELLGLASRVVRNNNRTVDTRELNHQLFLTLQHKYPNSPWAKRYKTWQ
jgi:hypothetical protein